jgi:hypothetical protein
MQLTDNPTEPVPLCIPFERTPHGFSLAADAVRPKDLPRCQAGLQSPCQEVPLFGIGRELQQPVRIGTASMDFELCQGDFHLIHLLTGSDALTKLPGTSCCLFPFGSIP